MSKQKPSANKYPVLHIRISTELLNDLDNLIEVASIRGPKDSRAKMICYLLERYIAVEKKVHK